MATTSTWARNCGDWAASQLVRAAAALLGRQRTCPGPDRLPGTRDDHGWFPRSLHDRSARQAPSSTPAASPHLRRRHSAWPPRRSTNTSPESASTQNGSRALHPGPYPPDSSRYYACGASTTGSLSLYPPAPLAGPAPSGSSGASRHRRSCFPPSPALPGSGCSRLQPSRCDGPAAEVFHLPLEHQAPRGALVCRSRRVRRVRLAARLRLEHECVEEPVVVHEPGVHTLALPRTCG